MSQRVLLSPCFWNIGVGTYCSSVRSKGSLNELSEYRAVTLASQYIGTAHTSESVVAYLKQKHHVKWKTNIDM